MAQNRRSPTPRAGITAEPSCSSAPVAVSTDWRELVERIRAGDPAGIGSLYEFFYPGIRFSMAHRLGSEEADDGAYDVILIVVQAIRHGELTNPARLPGYVRTVVRHYIGQAVQWRQREVGIESAARTSDKRASPEAAAAAQERTEIIRELLMGLSQRDRELLTRLYFLGQTQPKICSEMGLTETQFRLLRSRAQARLIARRRKSPGRRQFHDRRSEVRTVQAGSAALDIDSLVPVLAHAVAVFGDEHKAVHWLTTPLALLADRSPQEVLQGKGGVESVEQVLTRIEHNIPS